MHHLEPNHRLYKFPPAVPGSRVGDSPVDWGLDSTRTALFGLGAIVEMRNQKEAEAKGLERPAMVGSDSEDDDDETGGVYQVGSDMDE